MEWELDSQHRAPAMGKLTTLQPARAPRSGLVAKATDLVRYPQTWPHVALQDDFSNQALQFNHLDFRLFVAGELEIATSPDILECERTGRLRLLKQLAYLHGAHQWDIIRKIYIAVVRKIELGSLHWGSCFLNDIQWILTKHTFTQPTRSQQTVTVPSGPDTTTHIYCTDFNRGSCAFSESHHGMFRGRREWLLHACSKCLRKNITAAHPSRECQQ
jgi:hypothetical protein